MIANDLTVTKMDQSSSPTTFSLRSIVDGKSIRSAVTPLGESFTFTVSHSKRVPNNPASPDRHMFRFDRVKPNPVTHAPETLSMYVVLENPVTGTFVDADVELIKEYVSDLLYDQGFFDKFQNSEP